MPPNREDIADDAGLRSHRAPALGLHLPEIRPHAKLADSEQGTATRRPARVHPQGLVMWTLSYARSVIQLFDHEPVRRLLSLS